MIVPNTVFFKNEKMQFHYKGELYEIKVEKVAQK